MLRYLFSFLCLANLTILCGCVTALTKQGAEVEISEQGLSYVGCTYKGRFTSSESKAVTAQKDREYAINKIKNDLGKKGGNWLILKDEGSYGNGTNVTGEGYYCPPAVVGLVDKCDDGNGAACLSYAKKAYSAKAYPIYRKRMEQACENFEEKACAEIKKEDSLALDQKKLCEAGNGESCASYAWTLAAILSQQEEANFYLQRGCELKSITACKYQSLISQSEKKQQMALEQMRAERQVMAQESIAMAQQSQAMTAQREQSARTSQNLIDNMNRSTASEPEKNHQK